MKHRNRNKPLIGERVHRPKQSDPLWLGWVEHCKRLQWSLPSPRRGTLHYDQQPERGETDGTDLPRCYLRDSVGVDTQSEMGGRLYLTRRERRDALRHARAIAELMGKPIEEVGR